jgi:ATP-binding protein involved in chromosome partitioning
MAALAEDHIRAALESYVDPYLGRSLGAAQALRELVVAPGHVTAVVALGYPVGGYAGEFTAALRALLVEHGFEGRLDVEVQPGIPAFVGNRGVKPLADIANVIAVASGKGGVGKSTVAANLALALVAQGARVGLLDADIYGPSQPRMMGLTGRQPATRDGRTFDPLDAYGVKVMSIGFLIDEEQPMVWRGPMVTQALTQLLNDCNWGTLDYLIVDMPPGTGDTQLTLAQRVPVSGAVIVTTPQDIALLDARKGLKMFQKVEVPVLGIVENMSIHVCPACGHASHIFGAGGGGRMASQYGVELLGELPLDIRIREQADAGRPTAVAEPDSPLGQAYAVVARRVAARLATVARDAAVSFPKISVEEES